jgi:bacterioferritin-associated ferredoxin
MKANDLIICRCEEITEREIKEAIRLGLTTMSEVKWLTRAGKG